MVSISHGCIQRMVADVEATSKGVVMQVKFVVVDVCSILFMQFNVIATNPGIILTFSAYVLLLSITKSSDE